MNISKNNIRQSEEAPLRVEHAPDGLYVVKNAYEGQYEYFKDRPLPKASQPSQRVAPSAETTS